VRECDGVGEASAGEVVVNDGPVGLKVKGSEGIMTLFCQ
jgi:hypothetical protein